MSLAKKIGVWLGIVTAVVGLTFQVGPWMYDLTVGADIRAVGVDMRELRYGIKECNKSSEKNSELMKKVISKLEDNQRHSIELRAGLESLTSEVRIRHSVEDTFASAVASPDLPTEDRVSVMAAETDTHLSRARMASPRDEPLMPEDDDGALDIEVE